MEIFVHITTDQILSVHMWEFHDLWVRIRVQIFRLYLGQGRPRPPPQLWLHAWILCSQMQGRSHLGMQGAMAPRLQFPNQTKSKSFSFKHYGYCFSRMFRNHTGPEISQFLPCVLQFLDNLWRLFIFFFNYMGEIDHFTWTFWKGPTLNTGPSEKFLFVDHPKEHYKEREFKP